jgi:CHASE3 domain sensor protein
MISQHCLGIQNQTETKNLCSKERITPAAPASQPASQQQLRLLLVQQHFSDTSQEHKTLIQWFATTMQQQCKLSKERKKERFIHSIQSLLLLSTNTTSTQPP